MDPVITRRRFIERRPLMAPVIIQPRRLDSRQGGVWASRYRYYNLATGTFLGKDGVRLPARDRTNIEHQGPPNGGPSYWISQRQMRAGRVCVAPGCGAAHTLVQKISDPPAPAGRSPIRERTGEGRKRAMAAGVKFGRKP